MFLAISTSSVSSMVYEANPSTSEGSIPASSSAATMAWQARAFSDGSRCLAKAVCPIPTMAVLSLSIRSRL
jgi:hypothetical protein